MSEPATDTRERLMDAAEHLFAENGFDGTSLRAITNEADANIAAVNYHFQSKVGLIAAVFERRIGPVNRERIRLLEQAGAASEPDPPRLEDVIDALIAPVLRLRQDSRSGGENFIRLVGRMFSEPGEIRLLVGEQFRQTAMRFASALGQILPELQPNDLMWRMHFLIGSMAHTAAAGDLIDRFSQGACDPNDVEGTIRRLTAFAAAGFRSDASVSLPMDCAKTEKEQDK